MEKELCIRCNKPTPYHPNTPITLRRYYVEGSGQLCPLCYQELYGAAGSLGVRTPDRGQVSINISKPGITKGQHWHDCKNEIFIVVKGHGLIQMRNLKDNEVEEYEVSGDHIQGVWMKPGWTHNIINLSDTEDLVTVMWASEMLDKNRPDTFSEKV